MGVCVWIDRWVDAQMEEKLDNWTVCLMDGPYILNS